MVSGGGVVGGFADLSVCLFIVLLFLLANKCVCSHIRMFHSVLESDRKITNDFYV